MFNSKTLSMLLASILCTVIAMSIHIHLSAISATYVSEHMQGIQVAKPPYNFGITVLAYITFTFQAFGKVLVYYLIAQYLPANTSLGRGLWYGALLLLLNGSVLRTPLMDMVVGNPLDVVIVQHAELWLGTIAVALLIALIVPIKKTRIRDEQCI